MVVLSGFHCIDHASFLPRPSYVTKTTSKKNLASEAGEERCLVDMAKDIKERERERICLEANLEGALRDMTPEHLACPDHNSQLEPLRRAIESGVGTRDVPDDRDRRSQEEDDDPRNPSGRRYLSGYSSQVGRVGSFPTLI